MSGCGPGTPNYRNHRGELVNEVLTFDGDLVFEGHGTYLGSPRSNSRSCCLHSRRQLAWPVWRDCATMRCRCA
jgi:hypothetical protein